MKIVIFSPWEISEDTGKASMMDIGEQYIIGANKRAHKRQDKEYKAADFLNDGELATVDRLYIFGHGTNGDYIVPDHDVTYAGAHSTLFEEYTLGGPKDLRPCLSSTNLVEMLRRCGIRKDLEDIRLWVCKAGDVTYTEFGKNFAKEIRKVCPKAVVTAYTGYLTLQPKSGRKCTSVTRAQVKSDKAGTSKVILPSAGP